MTRSRLDRSSSDARSLGAPESAAPLSTPAASGPETSSEGESPPTTTGAIGGLWNGDSDDPLLAIDAALARRRLLERAKTAAAYDAGRTGDRRRKTDGRGAPDLDLQPSQDLSLEQDLSPEDVPDPRFDGDPNLDAATLSHLDAQKVGADAVEAATDDLAVDASSEDLDPPRRSASPSSPVDPDQREPDQVDPEAAAPSGSTGQDLAEQADPTALLKRRRDAFGRLAIAPVRSEDTQLTRTLALVENAVSEAGSSRRAADVDAPDQPSADVAPARARSEPSADPEPPERPSEQLVLALDARRGPRADRLLISDANRAAITLVERSDYWRAGFACLVGPEGSGKTHIARTLLRDATPLTVEDCVDGFLRPDLVSEDRTLLFEDLDRAVERAGAGTPGGGFEIALFHLLNMVEQRGARLLATGRTPPATWPVLLPDLRTRLAAATVGVIQSPDDGLLEALLTKLFDDRGVSIEPSMATFLARRMERSFAAAVDVVERVNHASLREQRPISPPLAAETLGWRPTRF